MYSIMFSLTLMDFTVLESTENGKKKLHTNNKNDITLVLLQTKSL